MKLPKFFYEFSYRREPVWMLVLLLGPALILFLVFTILRLMR